MTTKDKLLEVRTNLLIDNSRSSGTADAKARSLISEKLERSDKKEIERMINKAIKVQAAKDEKARKKHDADFLKSKEFKKVVNDAINLELKGLAGNDLSQEDVVAITKKVLVKLYRELAYNYTPVIDRIKL